MMRSYSDNLDILQGPFFFNASSNIRGLPGQTVSFVFPFSLDEKSGLVPRNVILTGTIETTIFALSDARDNVSTKFPKKFHFGEKNYPVPPRYLDFHKNGVREHNSSLLTDEKPLMGCRLPQKARVVSAESLVLVLDPHQQFACMQIDNPHYNPNDKKEQSKKTTVDLAQDTTNTNLIQRLIDETNRITRRNLSMTIAENGTSVLLTIPADMILQNVTAMIESGKRHRIIEIPCMIPSLKTRMTFRDNKYPRAIVTNISIDVTNRVQVTCMSAENANNTWILEHSKIYASTMADLLNPIVISRLEPSDYQDRVDNYVNVSRNIIDSTFPRNWAMFKWDPSKTNALCYDFDDEPKVTKWLQPKDIVGNPNINPVSFVSGTCTIPGDKEKGWTEEYLTIVADEVRDVTEIHIHDVPEEAVLTSFVVNAALGHMKTKDFKTDSTIFFSTKNARNLRIGGLNLFSMSAPEGTQTIDLMSNDRVLGFLEKTKNTKKNEDQVQLNWCQVDQGFKNFFLWVSTCSRHPMFNNLTHEQTLELFQTERFPEIIEIYTFLRRGYTMKMYEEPEKYPWVHQFIRDTLFIDREDIKIKN
jgi:hypothetical protein